MKLLLLTFFTTLSILSQDFSTIKTKTDAYPKSLTVEQLSKKIASDFSYEENKVKALFCWITKNIRYDLEEFYNPKNKSTSFSYRTIEEKNTILQNMKDERVKKTLRSRKGVCEDYAQTFAKACTLLKIENEVIKGYVRSSFNDIGKKSPRSNHAWNAVKLKNKWIYIDATWGAGHQNNRKWIRSFKPYYYDLKKDVYFKSHLPEESIWRLRVGDMDLATFYNQPIYSHHILATDYELVNTTSGFLKKDKNGKISISVKNIKSNQKVHFGFLGEKFAKKAEIIVKNGITKASLTPPKNANQVFFMIDLKVMLSFKIL